MPDDNGVVQFKDFTPQSTVIRFKLGDDMFDCLPVIPLATAGALVNLGEEIKAAPGLEKIDKMLVFFEAVLTEESAAKFTRVARDMKSLLGLAQFNQIIMWLLEVYGLRPTQASSDSSTGSDGTSTPSTDGAPDEE